MSAKTGDAQKQGASTCLVPLSQLFVHPVNVRRTDKRADIKGLAASIAAHGLLQNLSVVRCENRYGVVAGGRRLAALRLLAKTGRVARDFAAPCTIVDEAIAAEAALAQNVQRVAMNAMDEMEAFAARVHDGMNVEDVAARFGSTTRHVEQRLALGRLSPKLRAAYRRPVMNAHSECASARRDIAADITAKILADLDNGVLPWRKPWRASPSGLGLPLRVTGETYRGANTVMLWSAAAANGYSSPYWLTFNQAMKFGAHVRKGERGEIVIYYGRAAKKVQDQNGSESESEFRFLKSYVAFNADQIDNLPAYFHPAPLANAPMPIAMHEEWFSRLGIARILTRDTACYVPGRDAIGMPPLSSFETAADYAATLDHECCHATGAKHRLDRDFSKRFGDEGYAAEELVAEIGASMLGAHLHLPPHHIHDHASYIGHWMKLLRNDKRAFLVAATKAQAAVDWLLDKSPAPAQDGRPAESADVAA